METPGQALEERGASHGGLDGDGRELHGHGMG
jgi:hypothetical protein